jgi:hypothetical protein
MGATPVEATHPVSGARRHGNALFILSKLGPRAFKSLYNLRDPAEIQRRAEATRPIEQVVKGWPISTDPGPHLEKIHELQGSGLSIANIHSLKYRKHPFRAA